jgi:hypothetical protein
LAREDLQSSVQKLTATVDGISASAQQIANEVEGRWDRDKLMLTPGALLLDEVYKSYDLRFEKMRDAPRLATHLQRAEIDSELARLIEVITGD